MMDGGNGTIHMVDDVLDVDQRTGKHDGMTVPNQKPGSSSKHIVESDVNPESKQMIEVDGIEYEEVDESGVAPDETVRFTRLGEKRIEEARRAIHDPDAPRFDNADDLFRYLGI